jgi:signal transduction histidine kinase
LIQQAAIYAELYADAFRALPGEPLGTVLNAEQRAHWGSDLHPARAALNVRVDDVLPPRPNGDMVAEPVDPRHTAITPSLVRIAREAQKTNLSGVAFLTHDGRLLNENGTPSLRNLAEVQIALAGDIGRALRLRGDSYDVHLLASISRDTGYRVFVTYPVLVDDRVVGAIYLSRTPLNLPKFLFEERSAFLTVLAVMVVAATLIGWVLVRLISRPVIGLRDEALAVAAGSKDHAAALPHYGFRELATLGESVGRMASTLTKRSHEITTYTDHVTHELKSPVTTIVGSAELLPGSKLKVDDRKKLLGNIAAEGQRMSVLLERLREIARVKTMAPGKAGRLDDMIPTVSGLTIKVEAEQGAILPLTIEHGRIVLLHMAQNSLAHNATMLRVRWTDDCLSLIDNGDGIEAADAMRLTEPFFTTRRDRGGTGMGLAICEAILDGYGATLSSQPHDGGAYFQVKF